MTTTVKQSDRFKQQQRALHYGGVPTHEAMNLEPHKTAVKLLGMQMLLIKPDEGTLKEQHELKECCSNNAAKIMRID